MWYMVLGANSPRQPLTSRYPRANRLSSQVVESADSAATKDQRRGRASGRTHSHRSAETFCRHNFDPCGGDGRSDGCVTFCVATGASDPAGSELSPIRRPAHFPWHTQLLERHFEPSLCCNRRGGATTVSSQSG